MVIPKSKLAAFVSNCIQQVQAGRADAMATKGIQTDPFEMSFTVNVIDDTVPHIEGDVSEQVAPDTLQTTRRLPSTSTQTQDKPEMVSTERQVNTPGAESTGQVLGRTTTIEVTSVE